MTRVENNTEHCVVLQREFDAPRDLVYAVWTDPEYVALWWGIEEATIPRCHIDLRPGGAWHIDMLTASGALFPNRGEFREVVPGKRLVYTDVLDPHSPVAAFSRRGPFLCTVEFEDFGTLQTRVTLTITAENPNDLAAAIKQGMSQGIGQSLDKLARLLATLPPNKDSQMTPPDLNRWQPLTPDEGILWLKYWWGPGSANALAFARADGTWGIVSPPVNVPQSAYDHIRRRGRVSALIAPNAFHHLGQSTWRAQCPEAVSYAPAGALERLARKSPNIPYRPIEDSLDALAPANPFWLHGMKRPDLLLRFATPAGTVWWLGDQFSNSSQHDQKFLLRIVSRILARGPGFGLNPKPELVFVSDRKAWLASLRSALDADPPSIVVCAHGDPVVTDTAQRTAMAVDLVAKMRA